MEAGSVNKGYEAAEVGCVGGDHCRLRRLLQMEGLNGFGLLNELQ